MVAAAATSTPPVTPPRGWEVPVESRVGSQTGAEIFDVGTPAPTVEDQDKKVKEFEKKIMQLEATIQEFLQGQDPWHQRKVVEEPGGGDVVVPGKELSNKEDELKPMHPKDSKPPPKYTGARKDFTVWHENFTSMLRLRSSKLVVAAKPAREEARRWPGESGLCRLRQRPRRRGQIYRRKLRRVPATPLQIPPRLHEGEGAPGGLGQQGARGL